MSRFGLLWVVPSSPELLFVLDGDGGSLKSSANEELGNLVRFWLGVLGTCLLRYGLLDIE